MGCVWIELLFFRRLCQLLFVLVKRQRVLELLSQILVDRFATLQNWSSVLEAFNLLHNKANSIDLVFFGAIDGDNAFSILLGFI